MADNSKKQEALAQLKEKVLNHGPATENVCEGTNQPKLSFLKEIMIRNHKPEEKPQDVDEHDKKCKRGPRPLRDY